MTGKRRWYTDPYGTIDNQAVPFVEELQRLILDRHPEATFSVHPGGDNPTAIFLDAYVDLDDPFDLLDELRDRILDIQIEEGIPLHVLPLRSPARKLARQRQRSSDQPHVGT